MLRLAFALLLLTRSVASTQPVIYRAQSYTSGTDERDRPAALARCVQDVLVQVSGNPTLLKDPGAVSDVVEKLGGVVSDLFNES